ncbi:MAG: hypothetical protein KTV77_04440 [Wolbachia endosymbiont of Fragariocoptes setiger]|nr:hypothetical protein [Wolbachia endosymbiont of Fragariocoptes setiger]
MQLRYVVLLSNYIISKPDIEHTNKKQRSNKKVEETKIIIMSRKIKETPEI